MKVLIGLSGGMDSAVLLAHLLGRGKEVRAVNFHYGSKHSFLERQAAQKIADYYGVVLYKLDISQIFKEFESNLLEQGDAIPEGYYTDDSMQKTVVPGRNTIFLSILLGLAQSLRYNKICIANHSGDTHTYPDCRPRWAFNMKGVVEEASEGEVLLDTIFLNKKKKDLVLLGSLLDLPFEMTYTCYKGDPISCGKCGACTARLEAFQQAGVEDPLIYKGDEDAK